MQLLHIMQFLSTFATTVWTVVLYELFFVLRIFVREIACDVVRCSRLVLAYLWVSPNHSAGVAVLLPAKAYATHVAWQGVLGGSGGAALSQALNGLPGSFEFEAAGCQGSAATSSSTGVSPTPMASWSGTTESPGRQGLRLQFGHYECIRVFRVHPSQAS